MDPLTLGAVLKNVPLQQELTPDLAAIQVTGLEYDSRRVKEGVLFFAFRGSRVDGSSFAQAARERGASAVVSELARPASFDGPWVQVEHGRRALAIASQTFYAHPDQRVHFTGITGTNGKTTTSYLIDAILRAAGFVTGLLGTIEYRMAGRPQPAVNTTPESLEVLRFAAELYAQGGTHLTMEVSSHALALERVYGFHFHTAVFTNLTRDHLDFHSSMEDYAAAKRLLFAPAAATPPEWAVLNADDPASIAMLGNAKHVLWYGLAETAQVRAENVSSGYDGLHFDLLYDGRREPIESPLAGRINVLNILAAAGVALSYGIPLATIAAGVRSCRAVPGRFERVVCGQPFLVVVDYAHTDDALRNVIQVARSLTQGRVITLFGCGGDRDRTKRPLMGMAAGELSDYVVLTSDNPRSEEPLDIMNDALVGLRRFDTPHIAEPDRARAIRKAIEEAKPGDLVLIAGKGHEAYQVLKDRTIDFDDRETARAVLASFGYRE